MTRAPSTARSACLFALVGLIALAPATGRAQAGPVDPKAPLPPGHPQVGDGTPPGHPAVDEEGDEGEGDELEAPPPSNAGGAPPDSRFFNPPRDTEQEDPALPVGTLVVTIKDAQDHPLPHTPVQLGVLHSTVAKGDSRESLDRETDPEGTTRFDGLSFGSATTYHVSTRRGPATYSASPFPMSDKAGLRVTLHAYEVSENLDDLPIGMQSVVYLSLKEDAIQIEQLYSVFNLGKIAWEANTQIALPAGFKAFNKQDDAGEARVEEVKGAGIALRGTFPPGRSELTFHYLVPFTDETRQAFHLELPPRMAQVRVLAESSKKMGLEVSGFPEAKRMEGRGGKHLLVTEKQGERSSGGIQTLDITLSGLPTPGPGRWVAVGLAITCLGLGFGYRQQRQNQSLDADARRDLVEAREALLSEIVALERAHKAGEVGPKAYARLRASLVDALARIVTMIDAARAPKRPKATARASSLTQS